MKTATPNKSSKSRLLHLLPIAILGALAQTATAQVLEIQYNQPSLDRWNYPFNGAPGTRFEMTSFGAIETPGFDDHDAQLLIGFDTSADISPGLGANQYQVLSVTMTLTVSNHNGFQYDPSHDSYDTYGAIGTPLDTDTGRPINLWLTGYRDGLDQTTYTESTFFGITPVVSPAQGMRSAFAAIFDNTGTPIDISNNLKEQFEAIPLAIGQTETVLPGNFVPADTVFSFTFTPCQLSQHNELGKMLDLGELRFSVTSLQSASGGPGGGNGVNYPIYYTRENPIAPLLGFTPTLDIKLRVGSAGDFNEDGTVNFVDVSAFIASFTAGDQAADINGDCTLNFVDVSAFIAAFTTP